MVKELRDRITRAHLVWLGKLLLVAALAAVIGYVVIWTVGRLLLGTV